ncbi:MAG: hypothetical protein KTR20_14595 [Cellvibrionaceae bacterium]|nr:hypothetical protein [Cellvibrionaceae bacterium]
MSENEQVVLTEEDKALMRAFLVNLYKSQANSWDINVRMAHVIETMLREMEKCSKSMEYVPRPHGITKVGLTYIRKQLMKMAKRVADRRIFEIKKVPFSCKVFVARAWRVEIELVINGA